MNERRRRLAIAGLVAALAAVAAVGGWALFTQQGPDDEVPSIDSSPRTESPGEVGTYEVEIYQRRAAGDERGRCDRAFPVPRSSRGTSPLQVAFEELLAGPTPEEAEAGYTSWFSEETAGMLRSVEVSDGVARIDFEDFSGIIPNASTSCGSAALLEQLERTAEQFPEVRRAVYSFDGDVEAFYGWLQRGVPEEPSCSAAGLSLEMEEQPDLPSPVSELRREIVRQAVTCDYEDLEWLAIRDGGDDFTFSFGGGQSPAAFWHRQEEERGQPMRFLVELLDRPYGELDDGTYVWPSAFAYDSWADVPTDHRWPLRPLYDSEDFEGFAEFGAYIGYRVGIAPDGDWLYFVRGD